MKRLSLSLLVCLSACVGSTSGQNDDRETTDENEAGDTDGDNSGGDSATDDDGPNPADTDGGDPGPFVPPTCAEGSSTDRPEGAPTLTAGTWVNINPPPFNYSDSAGFGITQGMTIDPCNPSTVYVCVPNTSQCTAEECRGLFRSLDGGSTWRELGSFRDCKNIRVDPEDPLHLLQVGGTEDGFHVSRDGGETWTVPEGYKTAGVPTGDPYHLSVDPTDFDHLLVAFHQYYAGLMESFDGGDTWTVHPAPPAVDTYGNNAIFLYEPSLGIGNAQTWLFGTQGYGYWRTSDAGESWTKVSPINMQHGGATIYYSQAHRLYLSSETSLLKSDDNGETWSTAFQGNGQHFLSVIGDGTHLYSGNHGGGNFITALESNDTVWTNYNAQTFAEGPFQMAFDAANGILYSANVRGGVWALKVE